MTVRDIRQTTWCWQDRAALDLLRAFYVGDKLKRRATALAIYLTLTDLASRQYSPTHAETTHRAIWEATGTSETTVKQYLREFAAMGLVCIERQKVGREINLPNVYTLLTPGAKDRPTPPADSLGSGATDSPSGAAPSHHPEEPPLNNDYQERDDQFIYRHALSRKLRATDARSLAAQHTQGGKLNRAAFLAALPPRPR